MTPKAVMRVSRRTSEKNTPLIATKSAPLQQSGSAEHVDKTSWHCAVLAIRFDEAWSPTFETKRSVLLSASVTAMA